MRFEFGHFSCFTFILYFIEELCLLFSWCVGNRCGMTCIDEYCGRSRIPGAEDREWLHRSGTRWPDDQEVR
jgi:hypothetical protein